MSDRRLDSRRALLDLSSGRPEMSRFGVMKHLRVLEDVHLVLTERSGRKKVALAEPGPDP